MADVLLIDDDEKLLALLRTTLEGAGHFVATARDGAEGVAVFARRRFDLVLCDLDMPGEGGVPAIREIRRAAPAVPVVAMSGSLTAQSLGLFRAAGALGATAFLPKPFERDELLAITGSAEPVCAMEARPAG